MKPSSSTILTHLKPKQRRAQTDGYAQKRTHIINNSQHEKTIKQIRRLSKAQNAQYMHPCIKDTHANSPHAHATISPGDGMHMHRIRVHVTISRKGWMQ